MKYRGYLGKPTMDREQSLKDSFQNLNVTERRDSCSAFDSPENKINRPEHTKARANITTIHPLTGRIETAVKSTLPQFKGIRTNMIKQADNIKKIGDQEEYAEGWERDWRRKSREEYSPPSIKRSKSQNLVVMKQGQESARDTFKHSPFRPQFHFKDESLGKKSFRDPETLQEYGSQNSNYDSMGLARKKRFPQKFNESLLEHTLSPPKNMQSRTSLYKRKLME